MEDSKGFRLAFDEDFCEMIYSNKPCEESNGVSEYLSDILEEQGG